MDAPQIQGIKLVLLDEYIKAYERATETYDHLYLDDDLSIHILDIFDNFLNDYDNKHTVTLKLSLNDKDKYRYNPKALSYFLYKTPSFWQLILRCNNIDHPGEFELDKELKVPTYEALDAFVSKFDDLKKMMGGSWVDYKDIPLD